MEMLFLDAVQMIISQVSQWEGAFSQLNYVLLFDDKAVDILILDCR